MDGGSIIIMDTIANIKIVAADMKTAQKAVQNATKRLEDVHRIANAYDANSELAKMNADTEKLSYKLSKELFNIISEAQQYSKMTSGAFDITVKPLIDLYRNSDALPQELLEVKQLVGYENLHIDPNDKTIRLEKKGMKLDLGGIAKGYAIDKAVEALEAAGATAGLVNVGGDIRCFGEPGGQRKYWLIELRNPNLNDNNGKELMVLKLKDKAVATSGDYYRFFENGDERVSHIIDAKRASGADEFSSVTVIAKTATDADALATAVSVMGQDEGLKLIESLENTEAIFISHAPEYKITITSGAEKYIYRN